jgi:hypothetical protein
MTIRYILLLFIIKCYFLNAQNTPIQKDNKNLESSKNYQSVTFNGIWSWFSDPRAVYFEGKYKRTYTGWIDNYGDIHIAYYDHDTKKIQSKIVFDDLEIDDHNNPSLLFDETGHLLVFFNSHLQDEKPLYLLKSNASESIEDWNPIKPLFLNDNEYYSDTKNKNHTYTNPIKLSAENGKIFLFWRGINYKPFYSISTDNGETWSPGRILFMPEEVGSIRVPYTKVYSDGNSKIHFTFTDGHPTKEKSNALYYMYYQDGAFYKADGSLIKTIDQLPVKQEELDLVYKETSKNNRVWNWDIAQNKKGDPVIVYAKFPDNKNHIYSYAIYKNNTWFNYDLVNSGNWFPDTPLGHQEAEPNYSGGITIDHQSPNTLYLSVKKNAVFEIEKWTTKDKGETWSSKNITNQSTKNNIRPFVVRNAKKGNNPKLLWVENTKYIYYSLAANENNMALKFNDRFQTAIKMDIEYPIANKEASKLNVINTAREILDWQLENTNDYLNKTDYKHGILFDGITAYYSITNENRYKNELLNYIQYEKEEGNEITALENLIWFYNNDNNRIISNKLNAITTDDINNINEDIRLITLTKLLSIINEDDNMEMESLKTLYLQAIINVKIKDQDYNKNVFANTLKTYSIGKGINDGLLPLSKKNEAIDSWLNISNYLIEQKQKKQHFNLGVTGAYLLASKEVYKLLNE